MKATRKDPWNLDKDTCKLRNEVERLVGRLKHWRCVYTRYDKFDEMYLAFVSLVIFDMI